MARQVTWGGVVMLRSVFFDKQQQWRNGWWIAFFFLLMAALLFPLLLWSQQAAFEILPWHQAILILVVTWLCQRLRRQPLSQVLGNLSLQRMHDLWQGLLLGALLMVLPALVLLLLGVVQFQVNDQALTFLWQGLLVSLAVAVAEELLFRGFMFQRLIAGIGLWPAQLLIAAYFVLTHSQNPGMSGMTAVLAGVNIFIASLAFGFAYWRSKSLLMPIALHFAANWVQGSVLGFGVSGNDSQGWLTPVLLLDKPWLSGGQFGLEASVLGLCAISVVMLLLARKR